MKLVSLELGGFKSFAKATTLQFDLGLPAGRQGFTAIIGPNGSGKSNLAEAIRWVLGEQSAKQLRAQSREDVLFAGTSTVKRAGRAYVRLTFDNDDGRFPLEASEISIARSLTSGGESEYTVNGEPVRLLDLQHMLAEAGIGTKTYTVISQGMVDRYLAAAPSERRALFDEACGIKPLQLRLIQTQRKLAHTREHAQELHTIAAELAPRLRTLEREQRRQAERTRLEQEYAAAQATWLHRAWYEREREVERLKDMVSQAAERVQSARQERETVSGRVFATPDEAEAGIPTMSWTVRARSVLDQCRALFESWAHGTAISREVVDAMAEEISHLLAAPKQQARARGDAKQELDAALEAEVAAERELAGAHVGLEQAQRELTLLHQEIVRERGSGFLHTIQTTPPPDADVSEADIRRLGQALARLGEPDPLALQEYNETRERMDRLQHQLRDIEGTAQTIEEAARQLADTMAERFAQQFAVIDHAFRGYVSHLFGGGTARLVVQEEGIEIEATPPGKRSRHLSLLSGGERTLVSLALLLAIVDAQSPPFLVLDEVDAALDEANSARFSALLRDKSARTQCIVITHNRETMGQADRLYGVTMQQAGISTIYSVQLADVVET